MGANGTHCSNHPTLIGFICEDCLEGCLASLPDQGRDYETTLREAIDRSDGMHCEWCQAMVGVAWEVERVT